MKDIESKKYQLLTIDDSELTRNLIVRALKQIPNLEVLEASNANKGIEILRKNESIKLILIDITMPKYDGKCMLRYIKKHFPNHNYKICMLTGRNSIKDVNECLTMGCDDYIIKPFDIDRFRQKVNYHLGNMELAEIDTTYIKSVNIRASIEDVPFKNEVKIYKLTEYNLYFETNYEFFKKTVIKLNIIDQKDFFFDDSNVELLVNEVIKINPSKYLVTTRFLSLDENKENQLRAYIIAGYKKDLHG